MKTIVQRFSISLFLLLFLPVSTINAMDEEDNRDALREAFRAACAALLELEEIPEDPGQQSLFLQCLTAPAPVPGVEFDFISSIIPTQAIAQSTASIRMADSMSGNIFTRLKALRDREEIPLHGEKSALGIKKSQIVAYDSTQTFYDSGMSGGAAGDDIAITTPWGAFVNGEVSFGKKAKSVNEGAFEFEIPSVSAGIDYRVGKNFIVGTALGYSRTKLDFVGDTDIDAGELDLENYSLSIYGTYFNENGVYVDGLIRAGKNKYTSERVPLFSNPFTGETDGTEFSINLSAGYNTNVGATLLGIYARTGLLKLDIDGYSELTSLTNFASSGLAFSYDDRSVESVIAVLGINVSHVLGTENTVIIPQLSVDWEHEFNDDAQQLSAGFVFNPTGQGFGVKSDAPDPDYLNIAGGFSIVGKRGKSGFMLYEHRIDQKNIEQQTIKVGLRLEF